MSARLAWALCFLLPAPAAMMAAVAAQAAPEISPMPDVTRSWISSLGGDPLLLFQASVICALTLALVYVARLYAALLPEAIRAAERQSAALEALEKSVERQTNTMDRLADSMRRSAP